MKLHILRTAKRLNVECSMLTVRLWWIQCSLFSYLPKLTIFLGQAAPIWRSPPSSGFAKVRIEGQYLTPPEGPTVSLFPEN